MIPATPTHALASATDQLAREAAALRVTVCEDAPEPDRPIHVETLCEDAANLYDASCDMRDALADLEPDADPDPERVRAAVAAVTTLYLDVEETFRKIDSRERMRALDEVLLPRGGAWHPWITVMRDEVRRCRRPVVAVATALVRAWRDLAQRPELRLGSASIGRLNVVEASGAPGGPAFAGASAEMQDIPRRSE